MGSYGVFIHTANYKRNVSSCVIQLSKNHGNYLPIKDHNYYFVGFDKQTNDFYIPHVPAI